jgi:hypothetical protein
MQWILGAKGSNSNTTHPPVVVVNESYGVIALELNVNAGDDITLDASASYSPDANACLNFTWLQYYESSSYQSSLSEVPLVDLAYSFRSHAWAVEFRVPYPRSGKCVDAKDVM